MKARINAKITIDKLVINFKKGYLTPSNIEGFIDTKVGGSFNDSSRTHINIQTPNLPEKLLNDIMSFCKKNAGIELIQEK